MFDLPVAFVTPDKSVFEALQPAFTKHRFCSNAVEALLALEDNPVHLLIADESLSDMSGVELAEAVKEVDEERGHHTFIILISGDEPSAETLEGLQSCVDATLTRSQLDILLLSQAIAGMRLAELLNQTISNNRLLEARCAELEEGQLLDPDTGLGNRRFAEQTLADTIRQVESRGGAVCFLLLGVGNYSQVLEMYDQQIARELVLALAQRIQSLVRPLDVVTYFSPGNFALIFNQPSIDQCTAECYQRIFDGVRLKSYQTSIGFMQASVGISICASEGHAGAPSPDKIVQVALDNLDAAYRQDQIVVKHLSERL
jgi:diguanylate cyclase (GGDEF)-like protein